jgi:GT2 family glycosyltransferase
MQNFAGGSCAVRRDVYEAIGGHDEDFVGWGGEDVEFLDRLETRNVFRGAWMPAIHLWHPPAPSKITGDRNSALMADKGAIPPLQRIEALRARQGRAT